MEKQIRVGIAGYGVVGKRRREAIDRRTDMVTVAACDASFPEQQSTVGTLKCFRNYRELLDEPLDALFVCLPNYLAAEVTIAGLERGLHVFCEKPPGRDVTDIERVIEAEKKTLNQVLMYGFNHRYHESIREALRVIKSQELGYLINARGIYGKSMIIPFSGGWRAERELSGGGILLDQGIHMVDLMRLFCGEFTEVYSFVRNDFWKHDVEDNAYALMRGESGVIGLLHSSATEWRHRFRLELSCEKGSIQLSGILSGTKSYGAETITIAKASSRDNGDPRETTIRYNEDPSWTDEIAAFYESIAHNKPVLNGTSYDALKTMELVYRIYKADKKWSEKWGIS